MPHSLYSWYSLNALESLGQRQAQISGEIELKRLTRFRGLLQSERGSVRVGLRFGQQTAGYTTVQLEYDASFELKCQRCLEPMEQRIAHRASFVLVGGDTIPAGIPEEHEPIELGSDRFQPAGFLEDELIMSLPLIPRHARPGECGALARSLEALDNQGGADSMNDPLARY